jgi:hypothetical protein
VDRIFSLLSAGKNQTIAALQRIAPGPTQCVQKIWNSVVGQQILKPLAADYVGATLGSAFPQLTIGARVAEAVANHAEPTHAVEAADDGQDVVISTAKSRKWKVIFGLTAIAVAGGMTWILSNMTGSTDQLIFTTAGSIIGGMQALRLSGAEVPANYTQRSIQYYGACKGFNMVRRIVPVPRKLQFMTRMIGATGKLIAGTAGYNAQSLSAIYQNRRELRIHNHDKLLKAGITIIWGGVPQMAKDLASNVTIAPLVTMIAQQSLALGLTWAVNNRTVSNFGACSFNKYVNVIRTHPEVQTAIERFRNAYSNPERREDAKKTLIRTLQREVGVRSLGRTRQPQMQNLAELLVREIPNLEENLLGFSLSSREDSFHQEMKKIHLMVYFTFIAQKFSSRSMRADLPPAIQRTLYSNGARMLLSAYEAPRLVTEVVVGALDQALPHILPNNAPHRPSTWQSISYSVRHAASRVWKTLRSTFRFFVSSVPRAIVSKIRRVVRSIFNSIKFACRRHIAAPLNLFIERRREFEMRPVRNVRQPNTLFHRQP